MDPVQESIKILEHYKELAALIDTESYSDEHVDRIIEYLRGV